VVSATSWSLKTARPRSHRFRLTAIVSLVFGAILGVLFWLSAYSFIELEARETDRELETVLGAVAANLEVDRSAKSLDEISPRELGISVAVFSASAVKEQATPGAPWLTRLSGHGVRKLSGHLVRYATKTVKGRTIVAVDNWQDNVTSYLSLNLILVSIWLPLTAIVGGITWLSVTRTFRPLLAMADEAQILSKGVGSRLAVPEDAEFGPLAERLNEFLDKIQASVQTQERFVADAAHELRTPLTIMRGQVETTLLRERSGSDYAKVLNLLLDEAVRMSELVESLLVSSQASMTVADVRDITGDVQEAVDRWVPRFREHEVNLKTEIHPADAPVLLRELDSVLDNLLGNALRHSNVGSTCWVVLSNGDGNTVLSVSDEGPGIPDDFKNQVFERFYRTDSSRNRDSGGFGIGLAICKRIANERGATIQILDNVPSGAKFVVTWPRNA